MAIMRSEDLHVYFSKGTGHYNIKALLDPSSAIPGTAALAGSIYRPAQKRRVS